MGRTVGRATTHPGLVVFFRMSTPAPANQREALATSAERDGPYTFLPRAWRHLSGTPGDHEIRLQAFKHLLALGLVGPALELIDDRPDLLGAYPEVADVQAQVASLPSGEVAWHGFRDRFEANLAALGDRFGELVAQRRAMEAELAKVELFQCSDENYQLSTRRGSLPRRWLPGRKGRRLARDLVPIELRRPSSFEWKSSPYRLGRSLPKDADLRALPRIEYTGLDYLAAYWLLRAVDTAPARAAR